MVIRTRTEIRDGNTCLGRQSEPKAENAYPKTKMAPALRDVTGYGSENWERIVVDKRGVMEYIRYADIQELPEHQVPGVQERSYMDTRSRNNQPFYEIDSTVNMEVPGNR
jgi:hypothetical protein